MVKKKEEEVKAPEFPEVLKFQFPKMKEVEAYAVRDKEGHVLVRGADELKEMEEGVVPAPGSSE